MPPPGKRRRIISHPLKFLSLYGTLPSRQGLPDLTIGPVPQANDALATQDSPQPGAAEARSQTPELTSDAQSKSNAESTPNADSTSDAEPPQGTPALSTLPLELQRMIVSHCIPVSSACLALSCKMFNDIHKEHDKHYGTVNLQAGVFHQGRIIQLHELLTEWMGPEWVFGAPLKLKFVKREWLEAVRKEEERKKRCGGRHVDGMDCCRVGCPFGRQADRRYQKGEEAPEE